MISTKDTIRQTRRIHDNSIFMEKLSMSESAVASESASDILDCGSVPFDIGNKDFGNTLIGDPKRKRILMTSMSLFEVDIVRKFLKDYQTELSLETHKFLFLTRAFEILQELKSTSDACLSLFKVGFYFSEISKYEA